MTDVRSKAIEYAEASVKVAVGGGYGSPLISEAYAKAAEVYARIYVADVEKAKRYV